MLQPGRSYSAITSYRYGFNGKENDNDVKGEGNQQDYGMRIYDARLGRFLSVDPLTKDYPWYTPYQFAGNKPIRYIDRDGAEEDDPDKYYNNPIPKIIQTFSENIMKLPVNQQARVFDAILYANGKRNTFKTWGRWLSSRLLTRWAEGKGGYDILSHKAINSITVQGTVKDVRNSLLKQIKNYVSSVNEEGSYNYTTAAQFDRDGSFGQVLVSDVGSALGSFKIMGKANIFVSVDKEGNKSVVATLYYTLADKYQWKPGGGVKDLSNHDKMLELEKIGAKPFYIRSYFEETYSGSDNNLKKSGKITDSKADFYGKELENPEPAKTNAYSIPDKEKKKINDNRGEN